ncbi:MAG: sialate O-acetylesterase [Opitutaceae bacterium]
MPRSLLWGCLFHVWILAGLFLLTAKAYSQDKNFYVFLCLGQSNMEGFPGIQAEDKGPVDERFRMLAAVDFAAGGRYSGPERKAGNWYNAVPPLCRPGTGLSPADYFGRTLVANLPSEIKVGVVNVAVAGAKIEIFDRNRYEAYLAATPPNDFKRAIVKAYGGNPYQHLVEMGKLAQKTGVIKGVLLHQGESNNNDKEWPNKVKALYENLLKDLDLKASEVPLLAGELVGAGQGGACASMNKIIAELPKVIPTAHVVSSEGCISRPDHLHFTPEGYRELGTRFGQKMLSLLGKDIAAASPTK